MAKPRSSCAVRFLWLVAILVVLAAALAGLYRWFEKDLMRWAFVPSVEFRDVPMPDGADYGQARLWLARPDIANNPALWTPAGFVRSQASAFNGIGAIWAPKYRQATFGAFLTTRDTARRALDFAYRDVLAAYEAFLRQAPADRPIVLAAHSQGSLHLLRLLRERVRGAPEAERVVAAYVIGWPVSETADLPRLPFPACSRPDEIGCLLSFQSFGEPADPTQVTDVFDADPERSGTAMVCTNPLTGARGGSAGAERNLGTLIPDEDFSGAELRRGAVPARCGPRGFLLLGDNDALPELGPYALPGNNYHVYDYALFWANIRADAERRLAAFEGGR